MSHGVFEPRVACPLTTTGVLHSEKAWLLSRLQFSDALPDGSVEYAQSLEQTKLLCDATLFARDLANEQADVANPTTLAHLAVEAAAVGGMTATTLLASDATHNLGLLQAVGQGSQYPARLVVLEYKGQPDKPEDVLMLVGKVRACVFEGE
jgi:leucyl aminopeptidase